MPFWTKIAVVSVTLISAAVFGEPLPKFDAATVTGDALVALLRSRKVRPTCEEYAELNRVLAGRELVFHDLCICGSSTMPDFALELSTIDRRFESADHASPDRRFTVVASFKDEKSVKFARRVYGSGSCARIKEIRGLVVEPQSMVNPIQGELHLEATALIPAEPIEELPDFDAAAITGDELGVLCKTLKKGVTNNAYRDLNALLLDRELTFTDVQVIETIDNENGFTDLSCAVGSSTTVEPYYPRSRCLCLVVRVATKDIDALPWGFQKGARIVRLTGKVSEPFVSGRHRRFEGLPLTGVTFEVAWKNEKMPAYDAKTITGDELAKMIAGFDTQTKSAKQERLCRDLCGRRLTFAEATVKGFGFSNREGQIVVVLGFGERLQSPRGSFACELEAAFPKGEAADVARQLTRGQVLHNLSGVMAAVEADPRWHPEKDGTYRLTEVEFDAETPEALPAFDEKTITGDELVKLVWKLKGELSPAHITELQTRLAGRRLTFHNAWISGASGGAGAWSDVGIKFFDNPRSKDRREFSFWAGLREPSEESPSHGRRGGCTISATVTAPEDLNHATGFTLEDAVLEP